MIFSKKVTLYLRASDDITAEHIADLAREHIDDSSWLVAEEYGRFEEICHCGEYDCVDRPTQTVS